MLTTSPIAVLGQAPPGFDDKSLQSLVPIHSFYAIWGGEIWGKGNQGITLLFVSLILHFQDFPSSKRLWKAECLLVSKRKRSIEDCAHDWRESCSEVYLLGLQDLRRRPQTEQPVVSVCQEAANGYDYFWFFPRLLNHFRQHYFAKLYRNYPLLTHTSQPHSIQKQKEETRGIQQSVIR